MFMSIPPYFYQQIQLSIYYTFSLTSEALYSIKHEEMANKILQCSA